MPAVRYPIPSHPADARSNEADAVYAAPVRRDREPVPGRRDLGRRRPRTTGSVGSRPGCVADGTPRGRGTATSSALVRPGYAE
jgi:hypothetical protein